MSVDAATAALKNATIGDRSMPPPPNVPFRPPSSSAGRPGAPPLGGIASRRMGKPVPKLSGMDMGLHNAGLGSGRPNQDQDQQPPRRIPPSTFSTPFANFGKIV